MSTETNGTKDSESKETKERAKELIESLNKGASSSGNIWTKLGDALTESGILAGPRSAEKGEHMKLFNSHFTDYLDSSVSHMVPTTGYDRAGKKVITLRKKDGSIKWSAWQVSSRMMQYLSEIGRMQFHDEPIWNIDEESGAYTLKSRADILLILDKYKETPEEISPYEACQKSIASLTQKYSELVDTVEIGAIKKMVEVFYISLHT